VVKKQSCILAISLLIVFFSGCKKSEKTKISNFFGSPPQISEVSINKERAEYSCDVVVDLCSGDAGRCFGMAVQKNEAALDRVTVSARVTDPTAPNDADILVVVVHFKDPPPSTGVTQINQIALQMFDDGSLALTSGIPQIVSGDLVANDGVFTRTFYFATNQSSSNTCVSDTDQSQLNHTFSTYTTASSVGQEGLAYTFSVQAIDKSGNIDTSTETGLTIQGTITVNGQVIIPCGPPDGAGGCFPP
jgi:hypothetical protein